MAKSNFTPDERFQLISECRSSGLTDYQWCMEHNIKPGTFYSWINHLKRKNYVIPDSERRSNKVNTQEIVKIEVLPSDQETVHTVELQPPASNIPSKTLDFVQEQDFLEVSIGLFSAKVSNNVDTVLLRKALGIMKELSC